MRCSDQNSPSRDRKPGLDREPTSCREATSKITTMINWWNAFRAVMMLLFDEHILWCYFASRRCDCFPEIQSMFERYFRLLESRDRLIGERNTHRHRHRFVCQRPALCLSLLLEKKEYFEVFFPIAQLEDEGERLVCPEAECSYCSTGSTVCGRRTGFFPSFTHSLFPQLCSHFVHLSPLPHARLLILIWRLRDICVSNDEEQDWKLKARKKCENKQTACMLHQLLASHPRVLNLFLEHWMQRLTPDDTTVQSSSGLAL